MNHTEARRIVQDAWRRVHGRDPSDLETAYTQAIAWLESQYGRAGQFGRFASEGRFNWGSLHARGAPPACPPNSVEGFDVRPVCFLAFPDDVSAAAAFVRVLTKQHWPTIAAMEGTPEDVATAMRKAPAYYEGPPGSESQKVAAYASAIRRALSDMARNVPVPAIPVKSAASSLLLVGLLGAAGYGMYRAFGNPLPHLAKLVR